MSLTVSVIGSSSQMSFAMFKKYIFHVFYLVNCKFVKGASEMFWFLYQFSTICVSVRDGGLSEMNTFYIKGEVKVRYYPKCAHFLLFQNQKDSCKAHVDTTQPDAHSCRTFQQSEQRMKVLQFVPHG